MLSELDKFLAGRPISAPWPNRQTHSKSRALSTRLKKQNVPQAKRAVADRVCFIGKLQLRKRKHADLQDPGDDGLRVS